MLGGTGGLGREIARALGQLGARIDVHGRSQDGLIEALGSFRGDGILAEGTAFPLVSIADAGPLFSRAAAADILAAAWGPFLQKPLHDTTVGDWEGMASFNLALPGALVSSAVAGMRARGWGRILLLGGTRTDAIRGYRTNAAYAAAKTGLGVLAKSVAASYSGDGVAALVLCPGFVGTEYLDPVRAAELSGKTPLGRLTDPRDLGDWAADLLALEPPFWNGAVLTADEGLFAW
ncbi:MAG TPA: SDR family oxidoreductase [Magnetospirillaceae bacterium]|nr:SDR family oxidoreductase [Magnetospirillaceae bacterium]